MSKRSETKKYKTIQAVDSFIKDFYSKNFWTSFNEKERKTFKENIERLRSWMISQIEDKSNES